MPAGLPYDPDPIDPDGDMIFAMVAFAYFILQKLHFKREFSKISHEVAEQLALKEYDEYKKIQDKDYISDFDREINKLLQARKPKKNSKK